MKSNGLNTFDVVGRRRKSTPISATGRVEAVSFTVTGEVIQLASQSSQGHLYAPSATS